MGQHLGMWSGPMRNLIDNFWIDVIDNFSSHNQPTLPGETTQYQDVNLGTKGTRVTF